MFRVCPLRLSRVSSANFHTSPTAWARSLREFKLADIGEGITECELIKWNVTTSSTVQAFDPLCEVQSDKASVDITSPFDGVVTQLLVKEGEVARVGSTLCLIEIESDEQIDVRAVESQSSSDERSSSAPSAAPSTPSSTYGSKRRPHPLDPSASPNSASTPAVEILATPSVRHFARQKGVDLTSLAPGSGRNGRIERADVEAYITKSSSGDVAGAPLQDSASEQIVELGRTRYGMWKTMTKSLEIPQFGFTTSLDLTTLHEFLPVLNSHIPTQYRLTLNTVSAPVISPSAFHPVPNSPLMPDPARYDRLTYLPFLIKTLAKAMAEWPIFRSSLNSLVLPTDKPTLTLRPHADISIALSTPTGLYTPTIQHVDSRSVYELASRLKHLAALGRQVPCALTPAEMPKRGGTISVSNVGGIGEVETASPILFPGGGVAIVAIGRAKWVWDITRGDEQGERRLKLGVSWNADHRVVEGAELVAFVEAWRAWVEAPQRLIGCSI